MLQDLFSDYKLRIMKVGFGFIIVITLGYRPDVYMPGQILGRLLKCTLYWGKNCDNNINTVYGTMANVMCIIYYSTEQLSLKLKDNSENTILDICNCYCDEHCFIIIEHLDNNYCDSRKM